MITPAYVAEMARYNAWQNEVVYGLCDGLTEEERRRDRGMFFGSLHNTLDHIAMVDRTILDYLATGTPAPFNPSVVVHEDWTALKRERAALDAQIGRLADTHGADWFESIIEVDSARLGRRRRLPRALLVMRMFNHQTHHRSQVTAELWKLGFDYGVTDIPFRPDSPY
jgi:uncharacterized damage-inducible protein DinB